MDDYLADQGDEQLKAKAETNQAEAHASGPPASDLTQSESPPAAQAEHSEADEAATDQSATVSAADLVEADEPAGTIPAAVEDVERVVPEEAFGSQLADASAVEHSETAAPESMPPSEATAAAEVPTEAAGGASDGATTSDQPSMMELLLEESEFLPGQVSAGDLIEGIVVRKDKEQLVLDIGTKQQAVVPINDLVRLPRDFLDSLRLGERLPVVVVRPEWREGEVLASAYQARAVADWQRAESLLQSGEIVELRVVGSNKGGVLLEFGQLQGFVPRSHMVGLAGREDAARETLSQMVGTTMPVRVIEVNRRRRRLIMSHRQAARQWRADRKRVLMAELQEGTVRRGRVSSVADFGAFVDLGGADGLIHHSELTYERGRHPRDVVHVGQEVDVYVLSVDRERGRIGLSLKRLTEDPWATAEQEHYVGELVEVQIVGITKFGAFARLEDGLEGLIHISELADMRVDNPREVVRPGQRITVEILALDARRKRLGLSIRRVPEHLRQPLSELISQVAHEEQPSEAPAGEKPRAPRPEDEQATVTASDPQHEPGETQATSLAEEPPTSRDETLTAEESPTRGDETLTAEDLLASHDESLTGEDPPTGQDEVPVAEDPLKSDNLIQTTEVGEAAEPALDPTIDSQ